MRKLVFLIVMGAVLSFGVAGALAGKPVVRDIQEFDDEPFTGIGLDCATGRLSVSDGVYSGVIRARVDSDGRTVVSGRLRGTDTLTDLDDSGVPAPEPTATTEFAQSFRDVVFASGRESHRVTLQGTLTLLATGQLFRFSAFYRLKLDTGGNVLLERERVTCE